MSNMPSVALTQTQKVNETPDITCTEKENDTEGGTAYYIRRKLTVMFHDLTQGILSAV